MIKRGSCSVCDSPDLARISGDLMKRLPQRVVARRYGISTASINRHLRHVETGIRLLIGAERACLKVQDVGDAAAVTRPVLSQLRELHVRTLRILELSEVEKDHAVALGAVREARRNLELLARLTGELDPRAPGEGSGGPLQVTIVYQDRPAIAPSQEMPAVDAQKPRAALLPPGEGKGTSCE